MSPAKSTGLNAAGYSESTGVNASRYNGSN